MKRVKTLQPPRLPANQPSAPGSEARPWLPLPNYTLSTICPACAAPIVRRACKVRCDRCGFVWDCSEL